MSATAPLRRPAALRLPAPTRTTAAKPTTRPRLVLVAQRRSSAGRAPFTILIAGILTIGLVSVLLLHMAAAQDAYQANTMQQRLVGLTNQEQQMAAAVEADSSPAALRAAAISLGMKPTTITSIHRLKDGRAIGVQTPVYTPPPAAKTTSKTTSKATTKPGSKSTSKATSDATSKSTAKTKTAKTHQ